jgi:ribosomal protein L11 methylase PrmA
VTESRHPSSFRDRAGYVFNSNGLVYRQITTFGEQEYRELMSSGLYAEATKRGLLLSHKEIREDGVGLHEGAVLLPQQIPAISYPYEWCFSQLKDAATLVLDLQELALSKDMSLKDATAYNVQFMDGRPVFIDTSSFEKYREGSVWIAYRQFCEHFLAPLLLMSRVDVRLGRLLESYIDGIPIDLAASMVAKRTWLNPWLYMHVGLHGKAQRSGRESAAKAGVMHRNALLGLLKSLRQAVDGLKWTDRPSQWSDYSSASSYDAEGAKAKHELVASYLQGLPERPKLVWDLGANSGEFSRIFSSQGILTVAWDGDPAAVERNYQKLVGDKDQNLLPLIQDFSNPSSNLGWANEERMSFTQRGPVDLCLALALIHHLVIGNSVPLDKVARFFARIADNLIIEFVDPEDKRVQQLASSRTDTQEYDRQAFERAFETEFEVLRTDPIRSSSRVLYLMRRRGS